MEIIGLAATLLIIINLAWKNRSSLSKLNTLQWITSVIAFITTVAICTGVFLYIFPMIDVWISGELLTFTVKFIIVGVVISMARSLLYNVLKTITGGVLPHSLGSEDNNK
ncbi:hypothetical protein [Thalassobacillus hwangdonensis]|uniref:Holin n=1 Tax=Thalassobacillus hwangdonensis TaxID=546108 RepID=A0ABW3L6P2_9BACI